MRRFLPIIAALLLAASCNPKVDEEFLVSPDICLQENGKMILKYESATCQMSSNPEKHRYRIMDDTMSRYYMVTLGEEPKSVGQKIIGDLRWSTGVSVENYTGVEFTVEKLEGGQVWLWNSRRKIAVSIML